MDEQQSISGLKARVKEFCEARDWNKYHGAKDLAIGIVTESSELPGLTFRRSAPYFLHYFTA